jgi:hypothetical protein
MPLDAMLSESTQLALAKAGQRRSPITIRGPAANVGLVTFWVASIRASSASSTRQARLLGEFLKASLIADSKAILILDCHRLGIHGLLPGNAFESREYPAVIVLIALHRKSALGVPCGPR